MSSLSSIFKTDSNSEKNGVKIDYGDFYFIVARAGGLNTDFDKYLEEFAKPYMYYLQKKNDKKLENKIYKKVYAYSVLKGWGSKEFGENKIKFDDNGEILDFSPENAIKLFDLLPELFETIKKEAENFSLFKPQLEKEVKN